MPARILTRQRHPKEKIRHNEQAVRVATAAEGVLATTSLQPADIGVTVQGYDADLAAIAALASTGLAVRTGANTWAQRTITGTNNRLDVTNGNGVSGNPVLDISTSYVGQASITTLGTIGTGTWQGSTLQVGYGGTGLTSGTSGGIPYYSSTTGMSSSTLLATNALVLGGGAGAAPTGLSLGTARQVLEVNGGATSPQWNSWPQLKQTVEVGQTLTVDGGYSMVMAGPLTNNGTLTINGRMQIL